MRDTISGRIAIDMLAQQVDHASAVLPGVVHLGETLLIEFIVPARFSPDLVLRTGWNWSPGSAQERMSTLRGEPPLSTKGCTRARSLSDSLISHNSRSARSASASSKGRSCRHCSDHRKSQAGRNNAIRHRTRNNLGLDRCTKGAGCDAPCAKLNLSGRKLEDCYSVADDSPAGSRSHASVAAAGYEPAQPTRRPAVSIER
jgi:hypothetical protein